MENFFTVIEIPGDKRVNIGIFHLTGETDIGGTLLKISSQRLTSLRVDF